MSVPSVDLPRELDGLHVLVLPGGTDPLDLAAAWFPDAAWAREPVSAGEAAARSRPMTGARFRGIAAEAADPAPGLLRLDGSTSLEGPVPGGPAGQVDLYALVPAESHAPDLALAWMTAAARRAGGSVVTADRARVVVPDPGAAVDLTLWSAQPLSAQDALPLVRPAMSGARVGPTEVPQQAADGLTFSVTATFEYDGAITVRTGRSAEVPAALLRLDWRAYGPWSYRVSWQPPEPEELHVEQPSQLHLIARARVQPSVARVAAALWRAVGGTVVDSGGFVVPPEELQDRATARR
ncbi:hypothetical protein [Cellulomonas fengjieae]|uniref:Uncharacterized protein n=1 Tax=Cellulomonas fengjieae TaxID=2819978 RepID=A0ABS3SLB8_9CELL|nr:hypothetical protein [Cellulomonas fengjieae]MBO3086164.1 hypothetical protein [Cellulomonas fengjieae]MBO3102432.1 hypothetical protein [Cellulomonas fengjieae]QVI65777.1 hypothetical protein KG102_17140 [Cellulomonas fengjieae]